MEILLNENPYISLYLISSLLTTHQHSNFDREFYRRRSQFADKCDKWGQPHLSHSTIVVQKGSHKDYNLTAIQKSYTLNILA